MPIADEWIVTVTAGQDVLKVAADLRAAGAQVATVLDQIGSIVIHVDPATVTRLRGIPGVAHIEPSAEVDVGPSRGGSSW